MSMSLRTSSDDSAGQNVPFFTPHSDSARRITPSLTVSLPVISMRQTNGIANRIHVSGRVKSILDGKYDFEERGSLDMKGFGSVKTFLLK